MRSVLLASCVFILACSGGGQLPGTGAGGTVLNGNPQQDDCSTKDDRRGCTCDAPNSIRECTPLLTSEARGDCKPGTQTCVAGGSFEVRQYYWGECTGYVNCASTHDGTWSDGGTHDGSGNGAAGGGTSDGQGAGPDGGRTNDGTGPDGGRTNDGQGGSGAGHTNDGQGGSATAGGGTGDGLGGNGGGGHTSDGQGGTGGITHDGDQCACIGLTRWCDDVVYCNWGKQTCLPDGTWGPCHEVKQQPAVCPVPTKTENNFDEDCCKRLGLCCAWDNDTLVGSCLPNGCPAVSADLQ